MKRVNGEWGRGFMYSVSILPVGSYERDLNTLIISTRRMNTGWVKTWHTTSLHSPPLLNNSWIPPLQATHRTAVTERNFAKFFLWSLRSMKYFSICTIDFYILNLPHIFSWLLIMTPTTKAPKESLLIACFYYCSRVSPVWLCGAPWPRRQSPATPCSLPVIYKPKVYPPWRWQWHCLPEQWKIFPSLVQPNSESWFSMLNSNHESLRIKITFYFMLTLLLPVVSIFCVIVAMTCKLSLFYKKNVRICSHDCREQKVTEVPTPYASTQLNQVVRSLTSILV